MLINVFFFFHCWSFHSYSLNPLSGTWVLLTMTPCSLHPPLHAKETESKKEGWIWACLSKFELSPLNLIFEVWNILIPLEAPTIVDCSLLTHWNASPVDTVAYVCSTQTKTLFNVWGLILAAFDCKAFVFVSLMFVSVPSEMTRRGSKRRTLWTMKKSHIGRFVMAGERSFKMQHFKIWANRSRAFNKVLLFNTAGTWDMKNVMSPSSTIGET